MSYFKIKLKTFLLKRWYRLIKKSPADMPMVQYWKYQDRQEAKVTRNKDGALVMKIVGEPEVFPGFPRGYLLFGKLSKLKHEIKNQIFNYAWEKLEEETREKEKEIVAEIKGPILDRIFTLSEDTKYDRVPPERMFMPVREIYRAWTKVAPSERSLKLRDIITFILQEDDSYRFRLQWMVSYFNPNSWMFRLMRKSIGKEFERALGMIEKAEVISDMKERQRLLKRILALYIKHSASFEAFCREVDWKKVALSSADKYHFRGKYFKVDFQLFDY